MMEFKDATTSIKIYNDMNQIDISYNSKGIKINETLILNDIEIKNVDEYIDNLPPDELIIMQKFYKDGDLRNALINGIGVYLGFLYLNENGLFANQLPFQFNVPLPTDGKCLNRYLFQYLSLPLYALSKTTTGALLELIVYIQNFINLFEPLFFWREEISNKELTRLSMEIIIGLTHNSINQVDKIKTNFQDEIIKMRREMNNVINETRFNNNLKINEIAELSGKLSQQNIQIESLKLKLLEQNNQIECLKFQLENQSLETNKINKLINDFETIKAEATNYNNEINKKFDDKILTLNKRIDNLNVNQNNTNSVLSISQNDSIGNAEWEDFNFNATGPITNSYDTSSKPTTPKSTNTIWGAKSWNRRRQFN